MRWLLRFRISKGVNGNPIRSLCNPLVCLSVQTLFPTNEWSYEDDINIKYWGIRSVKSVKFQDSMLRVSKDTAINVTYFACKLLLHGTGTGSILFVNLQHSSSTTTITIREVALQMTLSFHSVGFNILRLDRDWTIQESAKRNSCSGKNIRQFIFIFIQIIFQC